MHNRTTITYTITPAAQRHAFGRARTDYAIVDDRQQEIARVYATLAEDDPAGTARLFAAAPALLELAHEALAAIEESSAVCLRLQDAIRRAEQGG